MSLNRPSYFFRMVFFVDMKRGAPLARAILKEACAKPVIDSSVLYMAMATPGSLKSKTFMVVGAEPSLGVKTSSRRPAPGTM